MNDTSSQPNCLVNNNNDLKPIFLGNSVYEFCNDKKNVDDQLTIWGLDNINTNDTTTALFDTNFNDYCENFNSEEPILNNKQCDCNCTATWQQLKQTFELTDEEILKGSKTLKFMFPEDIFYSLQVHPTNDYQDDNLDDFILDEEYMYTQLGDFNEIGPYQDANTAIEEKEPIIVNEPKVQPTIKKPIKPESRQTNVIDKEMTKSNDTKVVNKNIGSKNPDQKNIKNINQKQNSKNKSKSSKKQDKRYTESKLLVSLNNKEEENRMNNMKYVYTFGEDYRGGINYGHKNCVNFWMPIPHNKGWIDDKFLEAERKKKLDKKKLRIEEEQQNRIKAMETEKATMKRVRQERAAMRHPSSNSKGKSKKGVKAQKIKKVEEAVPVFKLNKNRRGIYTVTLNNTNDGRLDKTEEPVVFKLADHTKDNEDGDSTSSFNVEFITPTAIHALRSKKPVKAKAVHPPVTIVEEVLPPVKPINKKKV
ncbi:unnamed protein product [Macrosiphum euphorbiae]|uniref:Uncharacterized protein n=1 Tax=Macrosiphum euphorbiae TaxID=13131 RepID=A0AAV0WLT3_9HEMI|nr:unnamed protein product [Macrosiphum euphorbiae]